MITQLKFSAISIDTGVYESPNISFSHASIIFQASGNVFFQSSNSMQLPPGGGGGPGMSSSYSFSSR